MIMEANPINPDQSDLGRCIVCNICFQSVIYTDQISEKTAIVGIAGKGLQAFS